jgi:hypothetical protein
VVGATAGATGRRQHANVPLTCCVMCRGRSMPRYLDDEEAPLAVRRHVACKALRHDQHKPVWAVTWCWSPSSGIQHHAPSSSSAPDRILSPKSSSMRVMSQPSPVASGQLMRISRTLSSPSDTRLQRVNTLMKWRASTPLTLRPGRGHAGDHAVELVCLSPAAIAAAHLKVTTSSSGSMMKTESCASATAALPPLTGLLLAVSAYALAATMPRRAAAAGAAAASQLWRSARITTAAAAAAVWRPQSPPAAALA